MHPLAAKSRIDVVFGLVGSGRSTTVMSLTEHHASHGCTVFRIASDSGQFALPESVVEVSSNNDPAALLTSAHLQHPDVIVVDEVRSSEFWRLILREALALFDEGNDTHYIVSLKANSAEHARFRLRLETEKSGIDAALLDGVIGSLTRCVRDGRGYSNTEYPWIADETGSL